MKKLFLLRTNSSTTVFLWELLLFFLLILTYLLIIVKSFDYFGYTLYFNLSKIIIWLPIAILLTFLGAGLRINLISVVWHMVLLLQFYPRVIFVVFSNGNTSVLISNMILLIVLYIFSFISIRKIKFTHINIEENAKNYYSIVALGLLFALPFLRYLPYIDIRNLWLENVYQTRVLFRTLDHWSIIGYFLSPLSRVLLPAFLVVAIEKRRYFSIFFIIVVLGYLYLSSGAVKSIFFGIFCVVLFYFGKSYITKLKILLGLYTSLLLIGLIEFYLLDGVLLVNLPVRRLMFTPPLLEEYYFDFFKSNPLYYSYSFLQNIVDYNLPEPVTMYVGKYLVGVPGLNANVGIICDGYISLGWTGVILHSIFISLIFVFFNSLEINPKYFGIFFIYIYYFNNSFFSTLLLTHGLLFLVVFAFFCLRPHDSMN